MRRHRLRRRYGHATSLTFGVMPPQADFASRVGGKFRIEASKGDARMLQYAGARPRGYDDRGKQIFELSPGNLYTVVGRLANGDDESMALASSVMGTLGYEWI